MRHRIAVLLLLLQIGLIVRARVAGDTYFAWGMFGGHARYHIEMRQNGRRLDDAQVSAVFHQRASGDAFRAVEQTIDIVRRRQERWGEPGDTVVIRWRLNGGTEQVWQWPPP